MSVREQDLVLLVGGEALERYGVLVRRTSPTEDEPETYTRAGTAPMWDKDGYVRQVSANTPRPSWLDLDGDGIPETPVLPLSGAQQNLCEFNIPGGIPADTELVELDAVTNLAGEYAMRVNEGDNYQKTLGASWDPDDWTFACWFIPDFDYDDGTQHYIADIRVDGSNRVAVFKNAADQLSLSWVSGGSVTNNAVLTKPFAAGEAVFLGARMSGNTLILYADTNSDGTLDTDVSPSAPDLAGSWTAHVGHNNTSSQFEGALNLLITSDGLTADPITDRFNGGAGMALGGDDGWLARHGDDLVLGIVGNEDGSSVEIIGQDSITDHLDQTDGGRYDFDGTDDIDFGAYTESDGAVELAVWGVIEIDAATGDLITHWASGTNGQKNWRFAVDATPALVLEIATDGAGASETYTHAATLTPGTKYAVYGRFKGDEGTNADKVQVGVAAYDSAKQLGAWDNDTLGDASTPAALRTPTAVNLTAGNDADGSNGFDGKIDDLRLITGASGTVPSVSDLQAMVVNEANPAHWDHWWPFDTDASDFIGSLDGTVTGATLVDDGRHNIGGFHRFVKQGRGYFNGSPSEVSLGNWQGLDGATDFSMFGVFTPEELSSSHVLISRDDVTTNRQFLVFLTSTGSLQIALGTDTSGNDVRGSTSGGTFVEGTQYAVWIRYDGGGAANADRLKIAVAEYDPAVGTYGAFSEETLSFTGTIPSSLITPAGSVTAYFGRHGSGAFFKGFIDDWRIEPGSAVSTANLNGQNIYDPGNTPIWNHHWDFDGDYTDSGELGGVDGTPTDVLQWYDGRQPEGWTAASNAEIDRATDEAVTGTWGLRLSRPTSGFRILVDKTTGADRWQLWQVTGRGVSGTNTLRLSDQSNANTTDATIANAAQAAYGVADRHSFTDSRFNLTAGSDDEMYVDNLRAWEFTPQSFDTATAGPGLPAIDGKGGAWGIADAESVTASSEGIPLPYDSSLGTTITKLTTGPAGTGTRRYLFGLPGEMNGFTASTLAGMVVDVFIPTDSEVAPADVGAYATDDQATTTGDSPPVRGKWCKCWVARTWDAGATEAYFELRFADGVNLSGADEVLYMALPTIVSGSVPVVAIPNAGEGPATAIAAETFYTEYRVPPVASALYAKWTAWGPGGILYLGGSGDTGARIWIEHDSDGKVAIRYSDGTTELEKVSTSTVDWGAEIRFLGVLTAEGTIQAHLRIDQGALESTTVSAELELPDDWGDTRAYVGSQGGTNPAAIHLHATKVVRTSGYTLDEVEAVR